MKLLARYFATTSEPAADVLDDDLAAWLRAQAEARAQAAPSADRRGAGSRLVGAIRGRIPFRRVLIGIDRRPA